MPPAPQPEKLMATFPFIGSSLDLKTAEALVGPNNFLVLENVSTVETSTGTQLQKRPGSTPLTMLDTDGNAVNGGTMLDVFTTADSSELNYVGGGYLYAYSTTLDRWVKKGVLPAIGEQERNIARGGYGKANCSSAILSNVGLYAWEDRQGGVFYTVIDEMDGTVFINSTQVSSTASVPKVIAFDGLLHLFTADAGTLNHYSVDPADPTVFNGPTVIQTGLATTNPSIDVCISNTVVGVAYVASGSVLGLMTLNQATLATIHATVTAQTAVGVWVTNLNNVTLACQIALGASAGISFNFYSYSALSLINAFTAATTVTVELATAIQRTATSVYCYFQTAPTATLDRVIVTATVDSNTGIVASANFARGVGIASGIMLQDGIPYVLTVYTSTVQQSAFLMRSINNAPGTVVGKFFPLSAGPFPVSLTGTYGRVPLWTNTSSGVWSLATEAFVGILSVNGTPTPINGVVELILDFTQSTVQAVELGNTLHFSGMLAQFYDGQVVAEENFNVYPEQVTITQLASNIGVITTVDGSSNSNPSTAAQVTKIIFPTVPGASGTNTTTPADASLIIPGEYICFGGNIQGTENTNLTAGSAFYVWFTVGALGNDPTMAGSVFSGKGVQCALNATDTAAQIAQKFFNVVNSAGAAKTSGLYTPVLTGTTVTMTAATVISPSIPANTYRSRPALNKKFIVNQTDDGSISGAGACVVDACPGLLITGGQYFTFLITNNGSTSDIPAYAWFKVDGVGTDPAPSGFTSVGGAITVASTDTEFQVATKIAAQLPTLANAAPAFGPGTVLACTHSGTTPQVTVTNLMPLSGSPMAPVNFAQNPIVGGVAWGYLGAYTNGTSGTLTVTLSYQYSDVYEAIDNQGQLHRSSPGLAQTCYVAVYGIPPAYPGGPTITAVTGGGAFTITSKCLRLTNRPTVDIAIYRTGGNGSQFQRTTSPVTPLFNIPTQDYITYNDFLPDTTLAGNEVLYSQVTTGVIPNAPPPASAFITSHEGRLIYCQCEDRQQVFFTQQFEDGFGMAGSNYYTPLEIDPVWGPIVGAQSMDGNLIMLTEQQCWITGGSGPNTLNQGSFADPQIVNSTVGARDPQSIGLVAAGVVFKSLKGIYLLDRKFNANYIGKAIEELNDDVVTSTTVVNVSTQCRFGSATGSPVIWDYEDGQWVTGTGNESTDAVLYNGLYYFIRPSDGAVMQETPSTYADDGQGFEQKVQTWWIKPGNLVKGEARVWAFYFKGFFTGTNAFRIELRIDYDQDTIVDTVDLFPGAGENDSIWGGDALWGGSSPWGGAAAPTEDNLLQFRYQPQIESAEAYQLTIYDLAPYQTDQSWGLDSLDMEYGVIPGGRRLPQGASI